MTLIETINISTQIFTAIGTVGAVIISLWLALGSKRIKVKATIGFKSIYYPSDSEANNHKPEEVIEITITNTGTKPFRIYNIGAYDKQLKRWLIIAPDYNHSLCTKSGYFYSESETGTYIFPKDDVFIENLKDALRISDNKNCVNRLRKLNFIASTNLGQEIRIIPDKNFYEDFNNLIKKKFFSKI